MMIITISDNYCNIGLKVTGHPVITEMMRRKQQLTVQDSEEELEARLEIAGLVVNQRDEGVVEDLHHLRRQRLPARTRVVRHLKRRGASMRLSQ